MRAVSIIIRFVQLLAIVPVALGLSNAGSFFELLNGLARGQPWDFAEFAKRLAAFSSPTALGVALLLGLELLLRRGNVTHAQSLLFPEEPWMWNRTWADRRIRLSNRTPVVICLVALGIFAFAIVPVGLWMKSRMPDAPIYIGLGLLGLFLLALIRMTWLNRRWGRSELEILTLPGVIGGPFRGTVILSESLPEGSALRVTLNCIRVRTIRMYPSGDRHSTTDTIWQDQKILVTALSMARPNGVAIPCSFAIPFSCEPTSLDTIGFSTSPDSDPDEHISIHWKLSVGMKDSTDVREATFEIPVFRTESSSPAYKEDAAVDALYSEPVDVDTLLESIPLRRESSTSGERLRFSHEVSCVKGCKALSSWSLTILPFALPLITSRTKLVLSSEGAHSRCRASSSQKRIAGYLPQRSTNACFENLGTRFTSLVRMCPHLVDFRPAFPRQQKRGKGVGVWGRELGTLVPPPCPATRRGVSFSAGPRRNHVRF
jgi:hypothetical protein